MKKFIKQKIALLLIASMVLSCAVPAYAAPSPEDVEENITTEYVDEETYIEEAEEEDFRYDGKYPLIGNRKENSAAEVHEAYNQIFGEGNSFESIFEIQFRENQQYNSIIPGYFGNVNSNIGAISAASFICDGATTGNELFTRNDLRATENFNAKFCNDI